MLQFLQKESARRTRRTTNGPSLYKQTNGTARDSKSSGEAGDLLIAQDLAHRPTGCVYIFRSFVPMRYCVIVSLYHRSFVAACPTRRAKQTDQFSTISPVRERWHPKKLLLVIILTNMSSPMQTRLALVPLFVKADKMQACSLSSIGL